MNKVEVKYAIALTLVEGIGPINAKKLLAYCGSFKGVFETNQSQLERIPGIGTLLASKIYHQLVDETILTRAEKEIEFITKNEIQTFLITEDNYPLNLKQCEDSPVLLFGIGNIDFNATKTISIVGTRKVTTRGKDMCANIISDLKPHQPLIISGMAYGVDINTHKYCLEYEVPTIAVLAHGLDRLYPASHRKTALEMMKNGGLLTEFMSGTKPDRENFPKRNRIIAGLADVTVVIESARKGGSLITAELANSYNRDVFAVPGRISDPYSEGCNFLIKTNKAHLLNSAQDIEYLMNWQLNKQPPKNVQKQIFVDLPVNEQLIYDSLQDAQSITMDELIQKTKLSISKLSVGLLQLEFKGLVIALPGSSFKLA